MFNFGSAQEKQSLLWIFYKLYLSSLSRQFCKCSVMLMTEDSKDTEFKSQLGHTFFFFFTFSSLFIVIIIIVVVVVTIVFHYYCFSLYIYFFFIFHYTQILNVFLTSYSLMILRFWTNSPQQTVQHQLRNGLPFLLHLFEHS